MIHKNFCEIYQRSSIAGKDNLMFLVLEQRVYVPGMHKCVNSRSTASIA